MNRSSIAICLALLLAAPAAAQDDPDQVTFLGWAREIPRSHSASRDAPAFTWVLLPRGVRTASSEFAVVTIPTDHVTLRTGFYGLIELEGSREPESIEDALASSGIQYWRGAYGYHLAASFDTFAERICVGCGLEVGAMFRHESQHYTGSNSGGDGTDYSDRPLVGDMILLDAALRWGNEPWTFIARLQHELFIPGRSAYAQGPGIDLQARVAAFENLHLFTSGFAEYRFGAEAEGRQYPDAYMLRALLGIALPSTIGDIDIFMSADVGHRRGLAVFEEERTLGFGIRLALGPLSSD